MRGRLLDSVDDHHLDASLRPQQPQPELLLIALNRSGGAFASPVAC
jgi:hypothetical protein